MTSPPWFDYGILGVGEIGEAIVTGLCEGVEHPTAILLSPRNQRRATALAARYPSVSIASDNQSLVDRSSAVVLCVRPQDARSILTELSFRSDHSIISVMAGVSLAELTRLVAPAADLARAIPLPAVAQRSSVTPIHPPNSSARALFELLGGASEVGDPALFEAMSAATATIAAHFEYLATISRWLSERGASPEEASRYVAAIFADVAEALRAKSADLENLARTHATPGGINERFAAILRDAGTFDLVGQSLEVILQRLTNERG